MNKRLIYIVAGAALFVSICALCLFWLWSSPEDDIVHLPLQNEMPAAQTAEATGKAFYTTQELTSSCGMEGCDLRLLFVDAKGASSVVVDNFTALFRESTGEERAFVEISPFYFPPDGDSLIFIETIGSSACCKLTRFNVSEKTFDRYRNLSSMRGDIESPDNSMILEMSADGSALTVHDTVTNNVIARISAGPGETFIKEIGGYGGELIGSYEWGGNLGIHYSVYAAAQTLSGEYGMVRTEIDRRHFPL